MGVVLKKAWERSSYTECCGSIGKVRSFEQVILRSKLIYYETKTMQVIHDMRPYPKGQVTAKKLTVITAKGLEFLVQVNIRIRD